MSVEAGWQLSSSWRGDQNNPAEQVKKEERCCVVLPHSALHTIIPLQDWISSFRSPIEVNNFMYCLPRHWCWMPVTWLNKRARDCIGNVEKVYFVSRRGVDLPEHSAAAETSAGHSHWLTEVMRVGQLYWHTDQPGENTHIHVRMGFSFAKSLHRLHSGLVINGAVMVLISFSNKLQLIFFICLVKHWDWISNALNWIPRVCLKAGDFFFNVAHF